MKTLEWGFQLEHVLGIVNGSIRKGFQSIWFLYAKSDCSIRIIYSSSRHSVD